MLSKAGDGNHSPGLSREEQLCRHFSLAEIQLATQNFDEQLVIGRGGFGKVYRGTFNDGSNIVAAIKRLDSGSKQGAPEFWSEIELLSKLRHCHLVSIIGYCNQKGELIIVYEFMPHGTLGDHLHKLNTRRLSWLQRLKICIGAARGLDYLHTGTGTHHGVIHRDVKSTNILLDDKWESKISDFGLSKVGPTNQPSTFVSTAVKGTFGYLDPDYFSTGRLTRKSDVYAFGVVLLEVLCGRPAVDKSLHEDEWGLVGWAQDCIKEGKLEQIIDFSLRGQILLDCLKEFALIAQRCLSNRPKERPTMAEVVVCLASALALQETPDYSASPAKKITFSKTILKFLFPSIVHGDASPSRKNGKKYDGTSDHKSSIKDHVVSKAGAISQEVPQNGRILTPNLKVFTFADLRKATKNFSPEMFLGDGVFGKTFKGWIDKDTCSPSEVGVGRPIAVKRGEWTESADSLQGLGLVEWQAEVNFLGKFDHPNIINLLGYCKKDQEYFLVYEFMENRSLYDNLFTVHSSKPMPWAVRLQIMIGVARGLVFLHKINKLIHPNITSSSIYLDGNYNAKLSDFRWTKCGPIDGDTHVSTRVIGTRGYAAPEYIATGRLNMKSDVYSFGVVLLEVLTCQRALDMEQLVGKTSLVEWTSSLLTNKRKLQRITRLMHNYPLEGAFEAAKLAQQCVQPQAKDRPSMEEVLQTLEQISAIKISLEIST